jgi:hypothetical protein
VMGLHEEGPSLKEAATGLKGMTMIEGKRL